MQLTNPYQIKDNVIKMDLSMNGYEKMVSSTYFPQLSEENVEGYHKINELYRNEAVDRQLYAADQILKSAIEDSEMGPDNQYEWKSVYKTTYNRVPVISMYMDNYQYTGGAHGLTVRKSLNWHVPEERSIKLEEFFPDTVGYETILKNEILRQISKREKENPGTYFDNYGELVNQNFKPENFYIDSDKKALVIYFQQYEISPYSTGIPEFIIPIESGLQ